VFKRLLWLTIGASVGFGTSFWVTRVVKQTIDRYRPQRVSSDLAGAVRSLGSDVRAAVAEGRQAMHEQEAVLRAQLEARLTPPPSQ
jgi:hypothetical protein